MRPTVAGNGPQDPDLSHAKGKNMKKSLGAKTLLHPAPVLLVGTYDRAGKANAMTVAWAGICCSKPPCVAVSLRKATYSYDNIVSRKAFTVSVPAETQVREADYFGIASGRDTDKFAATGLTPVRGELVDAPYVDECPLVLECVLRHTLEIGLHTEFVGEILDVKVDEAVVDEDGSPDMAAIKPILFATGNRAYHGVGSFLGRAFSIGKQL